MAESAKFQNFAGAEIWKHFLRSVCGKLAQCKACNKTLKCDGGPTKGLHVHLKSAHQIDILIKRKSTQTENDTQTKRTKIQTIDKFVNDATLSAILARMTACDGLPFSIFITSQDLRKSLTALSHTLPKSATSIIEQVMKYGLHVTERIKHDIILKKSNGEKFSITFDEWTSMRNRRYLNLNVHGVGYFWNLGLVRIQGSFSAEKCIEKISSKLKDFELDLQSDIIAITTDGCSMMKKVGRLLPTIHQLCYAHGLQLVIHDIFYQKQTTLSEINSNYPNETDESDAEDEILSELEDIDGLAIVEQDNPLVVNASVGDVVNKVRRVVKLFKRSPLKNEILQTYVKEKHPNGLQLILDCRTRWSTLLNMLERIVKLRIPIHKALLDLDIDIKLNDEEFHHINNIVQALDPIKLAVEALCRREANLITTEATMKFLFEEIQTYPATEYNIRIIDAINQRSVQERYMEASVIMAYLHNPMAKLEKKGIVRTFCYSLLSRVATNEVTDVNTVDDMIPNSNSASQEANTLPVAMKLQLAIDASLQVSQKQQPSDESLSSSLKHELNIAEQTGERGILLEKVYRMLLTIQPTSVEAERIFSSCAYFCNKFRSSLSDKTLNTLCLIRNNNK